MGGLIKSHGDPKVMVHSLNQLLQLPCYPPFCCQLCHLLQFVFYAILEKLEVSEVLFTFVLLLLMPFVVICFVDAILEPLEGSPSFFLLPLVLLVAVFL